MFELTTKLSIQRNLNSNILMYSSNSFGRLYYWNLHLIPDGRLSDINSLSESQGRIQMIPDMFETRALA